MSRVAAIVAALCALIAATSIAAASAHPPARHHRTCRARHRRCRRRHRRTRAVAAGNPFAGQRLFVDPDSEAARQVAAWRVSRPGDAAALERIAREPQADWFGDWNDDIRGDVHDRVQQIRATGALPVLVAYDIADRDCGGYSAGGAASADAYRAWIRGFAAGLGSGPAAIVLEPDALASLDCLTQAGQAERLVLVADAVRVLSAQRGHAVYLDAGNSAWQPPDVMASRLAAAGVAGARGFSLNVSNFRTAAEEIAYGSDISRRVGGKPFVIDTSRNGAGPAPDDDWCNPPGRALGEPPTASTGTPIVDAFLWIKTPGESDGTCNGGPPAGDWWPDYALGLAQR